MNDRRPRILISACLLGQPVRYDGRGKPVNDPRLERWRREGRLVPICPELAGGLSVPRRPAERLADRVIDDQDNDLTDAFHRGAEAALTLARQHGCRFALLKQDSPSCATTTRYDGSFSGQRVPGSGITADLLRSHGLEVFGEDAIDLLATRLEVAD